MDLGMHDQLFIVLGASSGFGEAIAHQLMDEGAHIIAVARRGYVLEEKAKTYGKKYEPLVADVTTDDFPGQLINQLDGRIPQGILVNAGGPPSGAFEDITAEMWQKAYQQVFQWKVIVVQRLLPVFKEAGYGRILFIESVSVKQPVSGLILSNAFRPAVAGMASTLASEVAGNGITVNLIAPGYHNTQAMQRLYQRKAEVEGTSIEDAKKRFTVEAGTGYMGEATDFAQLACWLLSPASRYVTGQVVTVAGNLVKGIFG